MKRIKYIFVALFAIATISCNENLIPDSNVPSNKESMVITDMETKTSLNNGVVSWTVGDQLAIFDNIGGRNVFTNTADAVSTFTGDVTIGTTKFWGVYPSSLAVSTSSLDGTVTVTLPSNQTPAAGTFAENHSISVATGTKTPGSPEVEGITFKNVCGLVSFKVPNRIAASKVTFTSTNTDIAGTLTVDCETATATISSDGSNSITMEGSFLAGSTFYFVVAPGDINGFRIDVETAAGSLYYKSASSGLLAVRAGECINLKEIDFKNGVTTATAEHTYDAGVLTGTALTVNHGIPANMWNDVVSINANVYKDSTVYRTYSAFRVNGASFQPTGTVYLPQGSYIVTGTYNMNGIFTEFNTSFTVPAPTLTGTLNVSATTSYSLYQAGNISAANNHAPEVISAPSAALTAIAPEVLAELPLYYVFTLNGQQMTGTATTPSFSHNGNYTGLAWGAHNLTCDLTFDGVAINGATTCHITGLPYVAAPPKNTGSNPWSGSANSWTNDFVRLHKDTITQTFHAPADINVSVSHKARLYTRANKTNKTTYTLKLSETNLYNKDQSSVGGQTTNIDETYQNKLASTNPSISAINTYGTIDAVLEYTNVKVYNISISYR